MKVVEVCDAVDDLPDIKKGLACMLFGGSQTALPDGMKLRGDINILLLGDPSTAKSQMLKFMEKVANLMTRLIAGCADCNLHVRQRVKCRRSDRVRY